MTTAQRSPIACRICRALASGSFGSSTTHPSGAFDVSTPAFAHTNPWWVRQISTPGRSATIAAVSSRMTCMCAAPLSCLSAISIDRFSICTALSRTNCPSDFETTLWAMTTTSFSLTCGAMRAARSSPSRISGRPGMTSALSIDGLEVVGGVDVESEGGDLLDGPGDAGAVGELGVALARAHAERRCDRGRRAEQQAVRAGAVAVGEDHDAGIRMAGEQVVDVGGGQQRAVARGEQHPLGPAL